MTNYPESTQTENTKEWDKICKEALDCSMYYHADFKHEITYYIN